MRAQTAGRSAPPQAARRSFRTWGRSLLVLLTTRAPTPQRRPRGPPGEAPSGSRRARSIDMFCGTTRARLPTPGRARRDGHRAVGCRAPRRSRAPSASAPAHDSANTEGRRSSTTSRPLRSRRMGRQSASRARPIAASSWARSMPGTWISHVHEDTSSWSELVPGSTTPTPTTSTPSGSTDPTPRASSAGSTASSNTMSRYSAIDSHPVGRASPKLSCGRGVNPAV